MTLVHAFGSITAAQSSRLIAEGTLPPELLELFADGGPKTSLVNLAELTAILAAVLTFRERLRDREVLCFVDNTSALSWAVHGTVQNPEAAELAHALHLALAELGSSWFFFAYVPSAANITHIPSRACDGLRASDLRTLRELGAYRVPMVLPTVTQLQDLTHFLPRK